MKFYHFEESDFDYMAIIWAKNEVEAIETFEKIICYIDSENECKPSVIDVDEVFQMMIDGGFDGDRESMAIGQIGELYKIIKSKDPIVVWHNCQ